MNVMCEVCGKIKPYSSKQVAIYLCLTCQNAGRAPREVQALLERNARRMIFRKMRDLKAKAS